MQRKLSFLLLLVAIAEMAWAGEPWKDKPSNSWSDSDIKKILEDSPWSKTISVPAIWLRRGAQGYETGMKVTLPAGKDPNRREDPDLKTPPDVHDRLYNQFARFQLRWDSSRTVRTALRLKAKRQGSGLQSGRPSAPDPEIELPEYELLLIGDVLAPFPVATESELVANTVLELKDSKLTLTPTRVKLLRRDDGQILEARFFFRKTSPGGRPIIPASEKNVEFRCTVGGVLLRANFEPPKMRDASGPDLR